MRQYDAGETVASGKTKVVKAEPYVVSFQMLDQLTGGDAARKEAIPGMGAMNATQIANCMGVLAKWDIPTAFIGQTGPAELLCWGCDMVKLECVMRRRAWGSALQREPQLKNRRKPPYRFDPLRLEFFHKDTVVTVDGEPRLMPEEEARQLYLRDGTWAEGVYTDPFVRIDNEGRWWLLNAHAPLADQQPLLEIEPVLRSDEVVTVHRSMVRTFLAFEYLWVVVGYKGDIVTLVDMKIEFGRRWKDGLLLVTDEVNNGAWRIWPAGDPKRQLDKQIFREGATIEEVIEAYRIVTRLTEQLLLAA